MWSAPWACFRSFADLLKFVLKEPIIPAGANKGVFLLAPLVSCVLALAAWAVIPIESRLGDRRHQCRRALYLRDLVAVDLRHHHGRLVVELEISVLSAALRSAAQMVSYEVSIGFVIITVLLCAGSLNLSAVVEAQNTAVSEA